jgi:hypothetical protein
LAVPQFFYSRKPSACFYILAVPQFFYSRKPSALKQVNLFASLSCSSCTACFTLHQQCFALM